MLQILTTAAQVTDEMIERAIDAATEAMTCVLYVRATEVAFHIDARIDVLMSQIEYFNLVNKVEALLYPRRVAYFEKAYA